MTRRASVLTPWSFGALLVLVLLVISPAFTRSHSPPDSSVIAIQTLESKTSMCGGLAIIGNESVWWDCTTVDFFVLAVVNFDSQNHVLEQVRLNLTGAIEANYSLFTSQIDLTEEHDLPVILYPNYYWLWNYTVLPRCIFTISVQLVVDGVVIDYGKIRAPFYGIEHPIWSNATHYLSPPPSSSTDLMPLLLNIAVPFTGFFILLLFLSGIIFLIYERPRRLLQRRYQELHSQLIQLIDQLVLLTLDNTPRDEMHESSHPPGFLQAHWFSPPLEPKVLLHQLQALQAEILTETPVIQTKLSPLLLQAETLWEESVTLHDSL